jgi:hypothetical protein
MKTHKKFKIKELKMTNTKVETIKGKVVEEVTYVYKRKIGEPLTVDSKIIVEKGIPKHQIRIKENNKVIFEEIVSQKEDIINEEEVKEIKYNNVNVCIKEEFEGIKYDYVGELIKISDIEKKTQYVEDLRRINMKNGVQCYNGYIKGKEGIKEKAIKEEIKKGKKKEQIMIAISCLESIEEDIEEISWRTYHIYPNQKKMCYTTSIVKIRKEENTMREEENTMREEESEETKEEVEGEYVLVNKASLIKVIRRIKPVLSSEEVENLIEKIATKEEEVLKEVREEILNKAKVLKNDIEEEMDKAFSNIEETKEEVVESLGKTKMEVIEGLQKGMKSFDSFLNKYKK